MEAARHEMRKSRLEQGELLKYYEWDELNAAIQVFTGELGKFVESKPGFRELFVARFTLFPEMRIAPFWLLEDMYFLLSSEFQPKQVTVASKFVEILFCEVFWFWNTRHKENVGW